MFDGQGDGKDINDEEEDQANDLEALGHSTHLHDAVWDRVATV